MLQQHGYLGAKVGVTMHAFIIPNRLEHHEVVLPQDFECERCVMQIQRQAQEFFWVGTVFVSCADVSIVNSPG